MNTIDLNDEHFGGGKRDFEKRGVFSKVVQKGIGHKAGSKSCERL
jgi:hypothetical protein